MEEAGFNWGEYLEETGASAAPHTSFKHVEISIQSNFQPGMKLEVANKKNPDTYWVATVITTCGQLLLLRYCGYGEDRRADFWCDVVIADLHPVGWCTQNNKTLMPPDAIKEKYTDWTEFLIRDLTGSRTAPASLLEGVCIAVQLLSVSAARYAGTANGTFAHILLRAPEHTDSSVQIP